MARFALRLRNGAVTGFTESVVEQAALAWLESVGWQARNGGEIPPRRAAASLVRRTM